MKKVCREKSGEINDSGNQLADLSEPWPIMTAVVAQGGEKSNSY